MNLAYVEGLYEDFLNDPDSVSVEWRSYFQGLAQSGENGTPGWQVPKFSLRSIFNPHSNGQSTSVAFDRRDNATVNRAAMLQDRFDQLIRAYRVWGHLAAKLDPLGRPRPEVPELDPAHYGFSKHDLQRPFSSRTIEGADMRTLGEMVELMRDTYCGSIGVQFMHIDESHVKHWLQERMEGSRNRVKLTHEQQLRILTKLTQAVMFEEFIQKKYLGKKRFSLEGAESMIPLVQMLLDKAGEQRLRGVIIGMAHRGRLNLLANIIGKQHHEIFMEFEDSGTHQGVTHRDVKYHLGFSTLWEAANGHQLHLSLSFNPSHLDYVNPVVLGRTRANQDRHRDWQRERGMAILIHGDASFAGQGITQETLNLSQLRGFSTGGTFHLVVNNQIGFTTNPEDSRSSKYATDVAKMLQVPIFHVNGEDPEAVAQVVGLAMDFRTEFKRDVIVDMYCFRRYGHNEADEPRFTQPLMYEEIKRHEGVHKRYSKRLVEMGEITQETADKIRDSCRAELEGELDIAREDNSVPTSGKLAGVWANYLGGLGKDITHKVQTAISQEKLEYLVERLTTVPDSFTAHKKILKGLGLRKQMATGELPVDWATAEALAFASLADEGHRVRMSGQDTERGTFSQRHAILHDQKSGDTYMPLQHIREKQGRVNIFNSPLSEVGVLGFEYGYSLDFPDALVLWEAQFGDFANSAQVIFDQFITTAEDKWNYLSGLVVLLPHGFEGMGAEHSHARMERFLMLAADDNIQICNFTTPAQYFHALRRQVLSPWRKPLIVMSPKSLLRSPQAVSPLAAFTADCFHRILYCKDRNTADASAKKVLVCSGKIYYELARYREEHKRDDVAILRVEQLYPLPQDKVLKALEPYGPGTPVCWVQEEPENMGAWRYFALAFGDAIKERHPFCGVYRKASPSPATGSANIHKKEQATLISQAFEMA